MTRVSLVLLLALLLAIPLYVAGARKLVGSPVTESELRHVTGATACCFPFVGTDCFGGNCSAGGCGCQNTKARQAPWGWQLVAATPCASSQICTVMHPTGPPCGS